MGSKCFSGCLQCTTVSFWSVSWNTSKKYGRYALVLHVFLEVFPKPLLTDHCVFKGSSVRHILRPVPSQTSSCSKCSSLLAQPEASWCHQWVQRPAVHRVRCLIHFFKPLLPNASFLTNKVKAIKSAHISDISALWFTHLDEVICRHLPVLWIMRSVI